MNIMKDERGYLETHQVAKILEEARVNERDYALLTTLAMTGRRVSEVLALKPSDIDTENSMIAFIILKKKECVRRLKPVPEKLIDILNRYIRFKEIPLDRLVFKISRMTAFRIVRKYGHKAGIDYVGSKRIHPHHFRHSFCVQAARSLTTAADLKHLQDMMEHSNLGITEFYLRFNPQEQRNLLKKMYPKSTEELG